MGTLVQVWVETDYRPAAPSHTGFPLSTVLIWKSPALVTPADLPARLCSSFPHAPCRPKTHTATVLQRTHHNPSRSP